MTTYAETNEMINNLNDRMAAFKLQLEAEQTAFKHDWDEIRRLGDEVFAELEKITGEKFAF